jgi:arsenate reductase-like glutaredoxin family protein
LEASKIDIKDRTPASQKLTEPDARDLLGKASKMIVAKGKKVSEFSGGKAASDDAVAAMLGPTGNMRAPTLKVGKTLLVGFNEEAYSGVFGG